MYDIVFPKNNEKEFITMAVKLGYSGLCFVYNSAEELNEGKKYNNSKLKLLLGLKTKSSASNLAVVKATENSRDLIERKKADLIYGFEASSGRDFIHHRASGLNQILCKLAKKNNIAVGFSVSSILNSKKKPVLLGRIKQNIKLCRKYKVKMIIGSFGSNVYEMRSGHDLVSLFCLLGMHPSEARKALNSF